MRKIKEGFFGISAIGRESGDNCGNSNNQGGSNYATCQLSNQNGISSCRYNILFDPVPGTLHAMLMLISQVDCNLTPPYNCPRPGEFLVGSSSSSSSLCHYCTAGSYRNGTSCTNCAAGTSSQDGSDSIDDCLSCTEGTYSDQEGASSCISCPKGKYQNEKGQTACKNCPSNYSSPAGSTSSSSCTKCPANHYTFGGDECKPCPTNSASVSGGDCECSAGYYMDYRSNYDWVEGTGGRYTFSPTYGQCVKCPTGKVSDKGTVLKGGLSTPSPCTSCTAGNYAPDNASTCSACVAGEYCPPGTGPLRSCPGGYRCPSGTEIFQCDAGYYCPTGSSAQTACTSGNYCPAGSSTNTTKCAAGNFCTTPATQQQCTAGNFCPTGSTAQQPCPPGSFCPAGASAPTKCRIGTSSPEGSTSAAACTPCPAGTSNGTEGGTCTPCDDTHWSAAGAASCSDCPANSKCTSPSSYCPTNGPTTDPTCSTDAYRPYRNNVKCNTNFYNNSFGTGCIRCPNGATTSGDGKTEKSYCNCA